MSATTFQHIQSLLGELDQDEKLALIEELAGQVRQQQTCGPRHSKPLFGILKAPAGEEPDLDSILKQVREGWAQEWTKSGEWIDT